MTNLDDPMTYTQLDPQGMGQRIAELPRQCCEAWENVARFVLPDDYADANGVVILGMGGSAIGGDLLRTLVEGECPVPVAVNRDYCVPAYVGERTLVLASSYSGNTEETLSAFRQARERGARLVAVTTGGTLAGLARQWQVPLLTFEYAAQPRAALGHSLVLLLGLLQKLGLVADKEPALREAIAVMRELRAEVEETVPTAQNPAKQLAHWLYGRLPVVYGAGYLSEVARRWKGQFNENAKGWGFFEVLPELNHNAVVGYEHPADLGEHMRVIMLSSALDHPRVQVRQQVTQEILARRGIACQVVSARGESPLAQMLSVVHFGDHVSYYLALLNGVDPTPVDIIAYLKERLAKAA